MIAAEGNAAGLLDDAQVEALVHGGHPDSFAVLGMQQVSGGLLVRALLPGAQRVEVLRRDTGKAVRRLRRIHDTGLFETLMAEGTLAFAYQLRADGRVLEDPYGFPSTLSESDLFLFNEGTLERAYRWMGAHPVSVHGVAGVRFCVWAPAARRVAVVGDFNGWDGRLHGMRRHPASGLWEIFLPGVAESALYKFEIFDARGQRLPQRADPFARAMEHPPRTASRVVGDNPYAWHDGEWMAQRAHRQPLNAALSIYELHAGSWRRRGGEGNRYLSYRELADELIPYVLDLGFTHIQLMPLSEYPFDGSWGYQPVGLFAPTSRFGSPDDLRHFIDACHVQGIGVLLDWVPGHFPSDPHGLGRFDGSCLYEHEDVRRGFHPDWNTLIFNYGRPEVISYLLSNAHYWLDEFHFDGLRVDAVASMLYLDYSRRPGEWLPNVHGGRENLEAIHLLQTVNRRVYGNYPGILMVAEESTAWPGVSRPVDRGGLGFGFKWNMGWMNDTLRYMGRDPLYRSHHQDEMTFGIVYAWQEHFVLPISHDEVVHGKGSLLTRMPGDDWQKFANLRAYLGFMWGHPGKKLLFMGCEFAQRREWDHDGQLAWEELDAPAHHGVQKLVRDLNRLYRDTPALYGLDDSPEGFAWLQLHNRAQSILAWQRSAAENSLVVVVVNLTPQLHHDYRLGVPRAGWYQECINSDALDYGGSGQGNAGGLQAQAHAWEGQPCSLSLTLPPLSTLIFVWRGK
jgi:1,4-alpha-glucan branching enzyme